MLRYWLLTWTTYGTWLPGDRRGFVSPVRTGSGELELHNIPGMPVDADLPALREHACKKLLGSPVWLSSEQASVALTQFQETAAYRADDLLAAAIMSNHVHLVIGAVASRTSSALLGDMKSYASRALNGRFSRPESGTWWTESGSKRHLPGRLAVQAAIEYVRRQAHPMEIWIKPDVERISDLPSQRINNEREA